MPVGRDVGNRWVEDKGVVYALEYALDIVLIVWLAFQVTWIDDLMVENFIAKRRTHLY